MSSPRHLPVLDGLRAIAVLLVLWTHIPVNTPDYPVWLGYLRALLEPGWLGVEIFFVLSGFLITRILIAERERQRPVRWFLLRRMLRIFPIYYLLLLVMSVLWPHSQIGWCAVYLSNALTILEPARDFPLQHTWSLCIEEHFYLLWPFVVAFTRPKRPLAILLYGVLPVALIAAVAVCLSGWFPSPHRAVTHASPIRFFSIGVGCVFAYLEPALRSSPGRFVALAGLLLALGLVTDPIFQYALVPHWFGISPLPPRELGPVFGLFAHCCVASFLVLVGLLWGHQRWSPVRLLTWTPLRGIGRISYGLYLYHLPIYIAFLKPEPSWGRAGLVVAGSFAVAIASYWAIERPILRFASRFR